MAVPAIGASVKKTYSGTQAETSSAITTQASGSTLVAWIVFEISDSAFGSFTDSKGNTWTLVQTEQVLTTFNGRGRMYVCTNATGGSGHTFTVTGATAQVYPTFFVIEITNMGTSPVDVSAAGVDSASPYTVTLPTTTAANEWLVLGAGIIGSGVASLTESTGFTKQLEETDSTSFWAGALFTQRVTSTGTYTPSITETGSGTVSQVEMVALTLKEPTGGSTTVDTVGASVGSATAAAISGKKAGTVGAVAGTSTAQALSTGAISTVGAATGTAVASGVGGQVKAAIGVSEVLYTPAPALGIHNLTWSRHTLASDPTSTPGLTTTAGSTLLVAVANGNDNVNVPTDNKGNTFVLVGSRQNYTAYPVYGVSVYAAHNIAGGSGHVITTQQDAWPAEEVSMYVAEVLNGGVMQAYSQTEVLSPTDLVSGTVTATRNALLLAFWFGDNDGTSGDHTAAPRNGFTTLESVLLGGELIQGAMAYKAVGPGTYSVGWDETPQQGALLPIFAIQSSATGASVAGQSATVVAGTGAATATSTAAVVSAARAATTGAAAGTGAASVGAARIVATVGASVATATTTAIASTRVDTLGSATGASAAAVIAEAIASGTGIIQTFGAAAGTATASATSGVRAGTAGASSGLAAANAAASRIVSALASSSSTSTASASSGGVDLQATTGTATAGATVAGASARVLAMQGSSVGVVAAAAPAQIILAATGVSEGQGACAAGSATVATVLASSAGISVVRGYSPVLALPAPPLHVVRPTTATGAAQRAVSALISAQRP